MADPNEGFAQDLGQFYGTAAQVIPALLLIITIETNVLKWLITLGARLLSESATAPRSSGNDLAIFKTLLLILGPAAIVWAIVAEALAFFQLAAEPKDQIDAGFAVPAIGVAISVLLVGVVLGLMRALFAGFKLNAGGRELLLPPDAGSSTPPGHEPDPR